jgi:hypothetical protein
MHSLRAKHHRPLEELPGHVEIAGSKMGFDALLGPEDADKQKK